MTQERRLRVRTFTLSDRKEIISKIVREVLVLFKVEIVGRSGEADYLQLSVVNHRLQEITVKHRHVGNLAELNGAQAMLLVPCIRDVDGQGPQGLFAGDRFLDVMLRFRFYAERLWKSESFRHVNTVRDAERGRNRVVRMENRICARVKEGLDRVRFFCQFLPNIRDLNVIEARNLRRPERGHRRNRAGCGHAADILVGDEVQMRQHVTLVKVPRNLLGILNTAQHEMCGTTTL